jgi:hypothetical protein
MAKGEHTDQELPRSTDDAGFFGRRRARQIVASSPFAGRIGGNQEFVASGDDSILKKQPDAVGANDISGLINVLKGRHRHLY